MFSPSSIGHSLKSDDELLFSGAPPPWVQTLMVPAGHWTPSTVARSATKASAKHMEPKAEPPPLRKPIQQLDHHFTFSM